MTPQLMQAIKLLQLSNLDLVAYVEAELERNPLLERSEGDDDGGEAPDASPADDRGAAADNGSDAPEWLETSLEGGEAIEAKLDTDLGNIYQDDHGRAAAETAPTLPAESWSAAPTRAPVSSDDYNLEAFVAGEKSLSDHLSDQLGLATVDPALRLVGQAVISELDEAGYLRAELAEIAERLGAPLRDRRARARPRPELRAGRRRRPRPRRMPRHPAPRTDRYDPAMAALLDNLDLVAKRDHAALMKLCRVDDEDLAEMLAEIRALNPKPGNAFGEALVQPVIPDVLVRPALRRRLACRAQHRDAAAGAGQPDLLRDGLARREEERHGQGLSHRLPADGELAGEEPRPAGPHHPQGRDRDRPPAGRLPRRGRPAPPPAQPQDRGRGDRHARIDRVAGDLEQVHGDHPRHLRDEVFLHRRDRRRPAAATPIRPRPSATASSG